MKKSPSTPTANRPPSGLSPEAQGWWREIHDQFDLSDAGANFLLLSALESFDRMRQAGALVTAHGVAVQDKFGQLKSNPAVAAERDARSAMLTAFRQLGLDVLPPQRPGRPSGK